MAGVVLQLESVHHVQQNEPMTGGLRSSSPSAPQRQAPQMATKIQPYLRLRDGEVRELMQAGRKPVWLGRWASHPCAHPTRTEAPAGLCPGGVEGRGREPGPLRTPGFGEKRRGCAYGRGTGKGDPQRDSAMLERARRYGGATLEGAGPRGEGGSSAGAGQVGGAWGYTTRRGSGGAVHGAEGLGGVCGVGARQGCEGTPLRTPGAVAGEAWLKGAGWAGSARGGAGGGLGYTEWAG